MNSDIITINELFSGIGSQKKAFTDLEIPHKVTCTAEIDKDAMLSYAAIHYDFDIEFNKYDFPSEIHMREVMMDRNIGYDFKTGKHTLARVKGHKLKQYYLAYILSNNMGDISNISKLPYADFWTYSFPCTDLSVAGKQGGICKGTRSGLLLEVERLLNVANEHNELPQYLMLENVKNLVGKQFKPDFQRWLLFLEQLGYKNNWKVLNAKDYGIPQNRERVFVISIRKGIEQSYYFPQKFDNGLRLRDMLEDAVDEKYYLSETILKGFIAHNTNHNSKGTGFIWQPRDLEGNASCLRANSSLCPTDNTVQILGNLKGDNGHHGFDIHEDGGVSPTLKRDYKDPIKIAENKCIEVGNLNYWGQDMVNRVYSPDGASPALRTFQGGNLEPKIIEDFYKNREARVSCECPTLRSERKGLLVLELPAICSSRGRNPNNPSDRTVGAPLEQRLELNTQGTSNTLTSVQKDNYVIVANDLPLAYDEQNKYIREDGNVGTLTTDGSSPKHNNRVIQIDFRIRKLTPKECWRLMGFTDIDFERAKAQGVCDSQLYKQAGNSIVVNVLYYLYKNLFITKNIPKDHDVQIKFF